MKYQVRWEKSEYTPGETIIRIAEQTGFERGSLAPTFTGASVVLRRSPATSEKIKQNGYVGDGGDSWVVGSTMTAVADLLVGAERGETIIEL